MSLISKLNARVPTKEQLESNSNIKWLMPLLTKRQLWLINRRSIANAFFVGMFSAFTPWPLQMIQAAVMSIFFRANVPVAVALVWITNPITMGPIFYATYKSGALILGVEEEFPHFELSFHWMLHVLALIWEPLLLGSFLCGIIIAVLSWFGVHFLWHKNVMRKYRKKYTEHH